MARELNPFMGREAREIDKKSPLLERANNIEPGWIGKFLTQVAAEGLPFGRGRDNVPESQVAGFKEVFAKVFREFDGKDCLNPLTQRQWRHSFGHRERPYMDRFGAEDAVAFTATYSALSTQLLKAQEHRKRDGRIVGPATKEEKELENNLALMTHHIDGAKLFVELARLQEERNKRPIEAVPVAAIVFEPERTGKPPEKVPPETERPPAVPVFEPDVGGGTIIPEAVGQLPENTRPGCLSFAVGVGLWGINLGADSILRPRNKKEVKEEESKEKKKKRRRGGILLPIPLGCLSLVLACGTCASAVNIADYFLSRNNCQMAGDVSLALKRVGVDLDLRALCPENDRSYDKVEDSRLGRTDREEMPKVPVVNENVEAKVDNDTGGNGADGKIETKQEVEIKKDFREFPILKGDSLTGLMVRYTDIPVEDFMELKPEAMKTMSEVFMYNWRNNPGFADKYLQLLIDHPNGVIAEWGGAKLTAGFIADAARDSTGVEINLDIMRGGDPNGTYRNEVINAVSEAGFLPDADAEALMETMSAIEGGLGCTLQLQTKWLSADFVPPAKGEPR